MYSNIAAAWYVGQIIKCSRAVMACNIVLCLPLWWMQELQQKREHQVAEAQLSAVVELESVSQTGVVGRKKPPRFSPINRGPASPSNISPMSPTDIKATNTGVNGSALGCLNFRYSEI